MNASGRPNTCKSNEVAIPSGARVSNAWIICLRVGDNSPNGELIPHKTTGTSVLGVKGAIRSKMSLRRIMVVGGVTAHQAFDP